LSEAKPDGLAEPLLEQAGLVEISKNESVFMKAFSKIFLL
jgi:hypothetical protein